MSTDRPLGPPLPGWTPPPLPPRQALAGTYVTLEPLDPARHGADLFEAQRAETERLWTYRMQGPWPARAAFDAHLEEIAAGPARFFAYVVEGRALGLGSFMSIAPEAGSIEIGAILLTPALQRTRAGTEALSQMIAWAFDAGYRRVEWTCDPLNAASMRAAERLGFTYEAMFRQAYATKGRNRDKAIFAMTDADWPALSAAHRSWLAPANFDGERQRARLSDLTAPMVHARAQAEDSPHRDALDQPIGPGLNSWTAPPRPPREPMEGRWARVIPFDMSHAAALHQANSADDAIWDYMPQGPFEDAAAYAAWMEANAQGEDPLFFAIIDKADDQPAGVATYLRIAPEAGSIEVGYITYAPRLQRTRAGTEAMMLMMARAFALGYRRYEWKCNAHNAPSRRLAQRLGMSFEGVFRQAAVVKGRNRDTAWYAAMDRQWPAISAAFDQWSDPANFDEAGVQRTSLSALTRPILTRTG